jgi:hypothetical protein
MKCSVGVGSGAVSFIEIDSGIQKLIGGDIHREAHTQTAR